MGIRINKMCGWGLTDLVKDDPRINWDGRYFDYRRGDFTYEGYLEVAKTVPGTFTSLDSLFFEDRKKAGKKLPDPRYAAVFGSVDVGLENVMCVRPLSMPDWHRHDDIIDYLEAGVEPNSEARVLDHSIYPYSGYMDARTGERLQRGIEIKRWMQIVEKLGKEDSTARVLGEVAGVFEKANEMSYEYAKKFVVPDVSPDVRAVAKYLDIFATEDAWKGLRPMVYTYWG